MRLSKNFTLAELAKSSTADRLGIDNWPTDQTVIDNLEKVAENILQPVRDYYGIPFSPSSGYRSLPLNRALRSKDTSQHVRGQAADFELPGISNYDLADWIQNNLDFDQLILEFYIPGNPSSGWVHCSYVDPSSNRNQILTINKNGVYQGLLK